MNSEKQGISLYEEISRLISLRKEDDYWDFKREWYEKNVDLLHDIICMANNPHNCDAYIIIGVDEKNDYSIKDVKNDPRRKNTQRIVDFLKNKKFAGGIHPIVHVETITFDEGDIDVIVVENSYNTPFYLTEPFNDIYPNNIYTRVKNTNTPKNASADIDKIENLWRKRFHLNDTPLERFSYCLQNREDWVNSPIEYDLSKYYKYSPEFVLREEPDETRTGYEFYLFGQVDTRPSWYIVTLYCYQTALQQFVAEALDGGRCFIIAPDLSVITLSDRDIGFCFYETDSLRYNLQCFYTDNYDHEYGSAYQKYLKCILLFGSEQERKNFEFYVKTHKSIYDKLYSEQGDNGLPYFPELEGYDMDKFKDDYRNALVLKKMFAKFKEGDPSF